LTFENQIKGKRILVSGGTGAVGYQLIRRIIPYEPRVVRIFSRDENKQFHLQESLRSHRNIRFLIGDIRDRERLIRAMEDVDLVFHLAAMKHVESCEYNPFEAIKTNIHGTQNVIDAALANDVAKVIFTSTDKAVNPSNAMGASKLMAEKLMVAANYFKGTSETIFSIVRFGNVLCSTGSVIPRFVERIKNRQSIDLTDPNMTRYAITYTQAVDLIFEALDIAVGGEVIIREMPVIRISDLAEILQEELCSLYGCDLPEIRIMGRKAGEKLGEELITLEESMRTVKKGDYFIISPQLGRYDTLPSTDPIQVRTYSSDKETPMSKDELKSLLYQEDILTHLSTDEGYNGSVIHDPGSNQSALTPDAPLAASQEFGGH